MVSIVDEEEESWVHYLKYVGIAAVVVGLPRIMLKAWGALKNCLLDINCLMVMATAGALGIELYTEAAAVVFLFGMSEWFEALATGKSRSALESVLALRPETAILAGTGKVVRVEEVAVGDCLLVQPGERVPVDGRVVRGGTSIDESALTGESVPVEKGVDCPVSGGTLNVGGGYLEIEATTAAKDSAVARMVQLIEESHAHRSRTEKRIECFAGIYTPAVVVAAVMFAVVPWFLLEADEAVKWLYTALVLLVVSCPCALVISTPITYVSTLATAATHNVVIRGGEHLESLGRLRALAVDKTGTLTEARFRVRKVLGPFGEDAKQRFPELLSLMAAVEQMSTHPLAVALVAHAHAEGADQTHDVADFRERAGYGVEATVRDVRVQVGNSRLAHDMGWLPRAAAGGAEAAPAGPRSEGQFPREAQAQLDELERSGQTTCYLGIGGEPVAIFSVADAPRQEASEMLKSLRELNVSVWMLTGDRRPTAEAIASKLGITQVCPELLPEDKVRTVEELMGRQPRGLVQHLCPRGTTAMLGDGINDAASLAVVDVGIAMGAAGSQMAMENAQVILMDSDLRKVITAIKLGRQAVAKINQNIVFAVLSKVAMVVIAMAGYASLWGAIIADLGAMLIVTINSSLVLSQRRKKTSQYAYDCNGHGHGHGPGHGHGHGDGHDDCDGHGHGHSRGMDAIGAVLKLAQTLHGRRAHSCGACHGHSHGHSHEDDGCHGDSPGHSHRAGAAESVHSPEQHDHGQCHGRDDGHDGEHDHGHSHGAGALACDVAKDVEHDNGHNHGAGVHTGDSSKGKEHDQGHSHSYGTETAIAISHSFGDVHSSGHVQGGNEGCHSSGSTANIHDGGDCAHGHGTGTEHVRAHDRNVLGGRCRSHGHGVDDDDALGYGDWIQ